MSPPKSRLISKAEQMIHFRVVNVCRNSSLQVLIWSHVSQAVPNAFGNRETIALEARWERDEERRETVKKFILQS